MKENAIERQGELNSDKQRFLSPDELAQLLGVPVSWIYARTMYKGPGCIPRYKLGRYVRFKWEEVQGWLESHQEGQAG